MIKSVLLIGAMASAMLFAGNQQVVSLNELSNEKLESFTQGKLQDIAVACPAGMVLPLKFSLQGEFLALESEGASSVKILKTCFLKCVGGEFLCSLDGKNWKGVLEIFTGNLGVELDNSNNGPFINVSCELNQK